MVLAEGTNSITVQYKNVSLGAGDPNNKGANATVGIRNAAGQTNNKFVQWSFNSGVLSDTMALVFQTSAAPSAPTLTSPADTATGVTIPVTLAWNPAPAATAYDIYFGTTNPPSLATADQVATTAPVTTAVSTTYYWKIVAKNTSGSTPSAVRSFTTQACSYALSTSTINVIQTGGAGTFNITTQPTCGWTVTGAPSWINFTGGSNTGTNSGTSNFNVDSNPGPARSTTLTVNGQTVSINQAGVAAGGGIPATISWSNPAAIPYGTALTAAQLNATANVPGSFLYSPGLGAILNAGQQILTVTFTPNQQGFIASTSSVIINVLPAAQTISFAPLPDKTTDDQLFPIAATASSGLPVVFSVSSGLATITGTGNTVQINGPGPIEIQASQPGGGNFAAATPVIQKFNVKLGNVKISSILNAASYANAALAGNGYAVVFGSAFADKDYLASGLPLPTTLGGASITVTDSAGKSAPASLYYAGFTQANFVVPEGLAGGPATVAITNGSGKSATWGVNIASVAPALFSSDSSGKGAAAAVVLFVNGDNVTTSLSSSCTVKPLVCKPVAIDVSQPNTKVYLSFYGTGIRGASGANGVTVTVAGLPATVAYAGAQPTYPGLDQVNVLLDPSLAGKGEVEVQLTIDGVKANPVRVSIK